MTVVAMMAAREAEPVPPVVVAVTVVRSVVVPVMTAAARYERGVVRHREMAAHSAVM